MAAAQSTARMRGRLRFGFCIQLLIRKWPGSLPNAHSRASPRTRQSEEPERGKSTSYFLPRTFSSLIRDSQFVHQFVERRAAYSQIVGRGTNLTSVSFQGLNNHLTFNVFSCFPEGDRGKSLCDVGQFHVRGCYFSPVRHDDRAMDAVLEFSDIPGPAIAARSAESFRSESEACLAALRGKSVEKFRCDNR